jgi:hypothetical protein
LSAREDALWAVIESPASTSAMVWEAWLELRWTHTGAAGAGHGPSDSGAASPAMSDSPPCCAAEWSSSPAGGRARALERGQRSVHAWVRGTLSGETVDNGIGMVRVGYNFRMAPTFTLRPGFEPVHAARRVVLCPDGSAWALL